MSRGSVHSLLCGLVLAIGAIGAAPAQVPAPSWPSEAWNPQPLPDDLVLPLPCGGAIAWRPIPTPLAQGALADRPATMGQADPETDYAEYLRQSFLAGPFPGPAGEPPRYYLAKYEVTRDQWSAVMAETCPALPTASGRVPQSGVAWQDAIAFTSRLTTYLLKNAAARLPKRDDAPAFVRLPTEDEWEYAVRGGAAVSETEFGGRTYPMDGGIQRHAWFQGPRSAAGQPRAVGTRAANPLGLYDVYGNLAEWTADPFRLNKVGRPHGQAGGGVVRGGDFLTSDAALRSSLRIEMPLFDTSTGEPLRLRNVGLRPALGLVVMTADARVGQLRSAFESEAQSRSGAAEDPARLLEVLRSEATDPSVRQGLERVQATLRAEARARADQESLTIRSQIEAAASLARQVLITDGNREVIKITAETLDKIDDPRAKRVAELFNNRVGAIDRTLPQVLASYLRVVTRVGRSADRLRIMDEARIVVEELREQNIAGLPELAQEAARHMVLTTSGNPPSPERVREDIIAASRRAAPAPAPAPGAPPAPTPPTPPGSTTPPVRR